MIVSIFFFSFYSNYLGNSLQENLRSEYLQLFEDLIARIKFLEKENYEFQCLNQNLHVKLDQLNYHVNNLTGKVGLLISSNFK